MMEIPSRTVGRLLAQSPMFRDLLDDPRWPKFAELVNDARSVPDLPAWAREWIAHGESGLGAHPGVAVVEDDPEFLEELDADSSG